MDKQQRDVLASIGQRRYVDADYVDAVEEIAANATGGHGLVEIDVRGRMQADVRSTRVGVD